MAFYRALLHLLPRDRRRRHGAEMAVVFGDLAAEARRADGGRRAVAALWMAEAAGLLRFSWHEWTRRVGDRVRAAVRVLVGREPGPPLGAEIRWAWRALRTRGWRGVLVVSLLAIAMAANAIVFAAADSFVFNRVPYREADRLVEIGEQRPGRWSAGTFPELIPIWRRQVDLFSAVEAYEGSMPAYLTGGDEPRYVSSVALTPGMLEMIGARPRWGRLFNLTDADPNASPVALIAEDVAAQEFGDARGALGRMLPLAKPTRIVGIMPEVFRFPTGQERIWVPLDLTSVPLHVLVRPIARLAAGARLNAVSSAVGAREPAIRAQMKPENAGGLSFPAEARPIAPALVDPQLRRLFVALAAAAGCLLLVACANVVNLELSAAAQRARALAVSLALGASRPMLIRTVLLEGAMVLGVATLVAAWLTWQVSAFIATHLPPAMTTALANPIHIDARTIWFMSAVAAVAWGLASMPVAVLASRADVLDVLKLDSRSLSTSRRGVRLRHLLTTAEVALTVLLLVGASLNVQTYKNLLNLPTGFDTTGLLTIAAGQRPSPPETDQSLQNRLLEGLRSRPDVISAVVASASPPTMGGGGVGPLTIGAEPIPRANVTLAFISAGPEYFRTLRLPILAGRSFVPGDPPDMVVIDETFARRYWPDGHAVGATFHLGTVAFGGKAEMTIIGVAAHLRTNRDSATQPSDSYFTFYNQLTGKYVPLSMVVRLSDGASIDSVRQMLHALAPTARFRVERMADRYAATFADEQLASSIMSAFGGVAFVVAAAGVYGVMAFLVAARTREIGIRMALGADRGAVRSLVLKSSLPPVLAGAAVGLVGAAMAMHWVRSLFFGVNGATPVTFAGVALLVVATALAATWQPARQAGRVDPSRLLRE